MNTPKKELVKELRACALACRPIVEGPDVRMERKRDLRRLVTLAERAAGMLSEEDEEPKKEAKTK